jgi:hypothetical protein
MHMKPSQLAGVFGMLSIFGAVPALAQSAGEGVQAGESAELGGAAGEPAAAAGEGGASDAGAAGTGAGGRAGSGGGAAGGASGGAETRSYDLLQNESRACTVVAAGADVASGAWAAVALGVAALSLSRRRTRR